MFRFLGLHIYRTHIDNSSLWTEVIYILYKYGAAVIGGLYGAAVIGENCCVHPANGTHIICCCKSVLLNVARYLAKLNK
jgi:hypothetical protein